MNFCRDCRHVGYVESLTGPLAICQSPQRSKIIDLVTGETRFEYRYCSTLRMGIADCGPDGAWFEAKDVTADDVRDACDGEAQGNETEMGR